VHCYTLVQKKPHTIARSHVIDQFKNNVDAARLSKVLIKTSIKLHIYYTINKVWCRSTLGEDIDNIGDFYDSLMAHDIYPAGVLIA